MSYKAEVWAEVAKSYQRMVSNYERPFEPMLRLVKEIAESPYASALYGNTSMWDVRIVQTPEYDPQGEMLLIKYAPERGEFTFELQETSSTKYKRWTRKSSVENAFQTFERFLQLKKWFVVEKKQSV